APCEAGLPTRDINVSSSVTFWPGTSPPKSLHVPPGQSGFTATPLAGSHNVPVPPTHMAPADVTTGGPAGLGNTMVLTLVRCALPMTRDTMVSAAAGTNVTPAPVAVVIGLIGSVPPPLNATVRMPPGRVSRPSPLLACGSKTPSTGLPMFSMVFEVNPVNSSVRWMLLSAGKCRMPPVRLVPNDVTTGSGGSLEVSLMGSPVPLVIMMLVTCEPNAPADGLETIT